MDILKSFLIYRRRFFFEIFIAYRAYWFCELLFVQKMGFEGRGTLQILGNLNLNRLLALG